MALAAALVLVVLGLLPIANWIPGGHEASWYPDRLIGWGVGSAIVIVASLAVGVAVHLRPTLWSSGLWHRAALRWRGAGRRADAGISLAAAITYAFISRSVFSGKPLLTDEIIQVFQARIFASGRLWVPASPYPEFTSAINLLDWGGKVYGQFPAGGPAMLAIGTLLQAEWLVGPVAAALGVFVFARLVRIIELRDGAALAALLLVAFAPFCAFLDGSMMNHVTTVTWLLVASLALAIATRTDAAVPRATLATGFALGMATTIRPLDGIAFALPAAIWLVVRAARGGMPHVRALLWSGLGIAVPLAALLAVNAAQTGHPFELGYVAMWGKSVEVGFHEAPWGFPHTPARGIELVNLYLLRLQTWFLETPVPALLFATGALALTRTLRSFDRYLLVCSGLLLLAYFAYWHDGFYLGPRFMLPLAPWLALWTARLPATMAERRLPLLAQRMVLAGGIVSLVIAALVLLPVRVEQYRNGMTPARLDADAAAETAGVRNAVVFVRESWASQLYVRMWALGVSRVESSRIFTRMDACRLDGLLTDVEGRGEGAAAFLDQARPMAATSSRLVRMRVAGDSAIHLTAGEVITPVCLRRIRENQAGFTVFTPFLLAGRSGNLFVRDLHARDSLLLRSHPGRPAYLLVKDTMATAPLRLLPLSLDSALAEWREIGTQRP